MKSNGSARGDEKSRTDSILPLKTEAPVRRKVLFWKVTGDALTAVHASPKAGLDLKAMGREVARQQERRQNIYDPSAILWGYIYSRSGSLMDIFES
jgi:hypothetical protein